MADVMEEYDLQRNLRRKGVPHSLGSSAPVLDSPTSVCWTTTTAFSSSLTLMTLSTATVLVYGVDGTSSMLSRTPTSPFSADEVMILIFRSSILFV